MSYRLAVDLGTTFTAAAVSNGMAPTMVGLGNRALQIPSVLFLTPERGFLVGESAERHGLAQPDRLVREFKRRIGDSVPMLVAGSPYSPQGLTARLLRHVLHTVTEWMGSAPVQVVLTHPANWGPYKLELLDQVASLAEAGPVVRCAEPLAAAAQYAAQTRVEVGATIAVYDLGGGTFDACVLQKTPTGFTLLGSPEGIEQLGGIDFDEALFGYALGMLGIRRNQLDPQDSDSTYRLERLRRDCVDAKEALSTDTDTILAVALPGLSTTLRLNRSEFEALIRPALSETVEALGRALRSANVTPNQLSAIVLIGGSSRIPLVGELLQQAFPTPTALDTHPKHDVALGALYSVGPNGTQPAPQPSPPITGQPPERVQSAAVHPESATQGGGGSQPAIANSNLAPSSAAVLRRHRRVHASRTRPVLSLFAAGLVVASLTLAIFLPQTLGHHPKAASVPSTSVPSTSVTPTPPPAPICGFVDEFEGATLDKAWERTRPNAAVKLAAGAAELTAPDGADIYEGNLKAPMLLREITGDFVLETDVTATPHQFYQGAGLVLRSGPQNYVRLERGFVQVSGIDFEYKDGGLPIRVRSPRRGPELLQTDAKRVVLQVTRKGKTISARWRPFDEPRFRELGRITVTFPEAIRAGISVLNRAQFGASPTVFRARFKHVELSC